MEVRRDAGGLVGLKANLDGTSRCVRLIAVQPTEERHARMSRKEVTAAPQQVHMQCVQVQEMWQRRLHYAA